MTDINTETTSMTMNEALRHLERDTSLVEQRTRWAVKTFNDCFGEDKNIFAFDIDDATKLTEAFELLISSGKISQYTGEKQLHDLDIIVGEALTDFAPHLPPSMISFINLEHMDRH